MSQERCVKFNSQIESDEFPSEFIHIKRGSYADVWKTKWRNEEVALKIFFKHEDKNEEIKELNRIRTFAEKIEHSNVIGLIGLTSCNERDPFTNFLSSEIRPALVMEYMSGGDLDKVLHEQKNFKYTLEQALQWSLQCAKGINYLHSLGLIHRDLKPENLLFSNDQNTLKICDFGTIRNIKHTMTKEVGTEWYIAPEVFLSEHYDEKCDSFSWSIIYWEILTRNKPYDDRIAQIAFNVANHNLRPPKIAKCPVFVSDLIEFCWQSDANKRKSMNEIIDDLNFLIDKNSQFNSKKLTEQR